MQSVALRLLISEIMDETVMVGYLVIHTLVKQWKMVISLFLRQIIYQAQLQVCHFILLEMLHLL